MQNQVVAPQASQPQINNGQPSPEKQSYLGGAVNQQGLSANHDQNNNSDQPQNPPQGPIIQ